MILGSNITFRRPELCAETRALITNMSTRPTPGRADLINNTIVALKGAGLWSKIDVMWFPASETAQAGRLNWKLPGTYSLVEGFNPTHTVDRGYAGDGTEDYLDTQWNPSTNGVQFTLNSATLGIYVNAGTDTATDNTIMGTWDGTNGLWVGVRRTGDTIGGRMNSAVGGVGGGVITTRYGLTAQSRVDSNNQNAYRNGALISSNTAASSAVANLRLYLLARRDTGQAWAFVDNRVAFAFAGGSLTDAQHAALYNIVQSHLRAIGGHV
jgi:Ni/Co efflux regulator RcnB